MFDEVTTMIDQPSFEIVQHVLSVVAGIVAVLTYQRLRRQDATAATVGVTESRDTANEARRIAEELDQRCRICARDVAEFKLRTTVEMVALRTSAAETARSLEMSEQRLAKAIEVMGQDFRAGLTDLGDRIERLAANFNAYLRSQVPAAGRHDDP